MAAPTRDRWAEWLLRRGTAGDKEGWLEFLRPVRDRVLENATLSEGYTLLDVGAGDGMIAFGALGLVGESGTVVFSDVSQDLLDHSHARAAETGVLDRCRFVKRAQVFGRGAFDDSSVDAVTTRSVLIYVQDKRRAFEEFHRVLKPGGRLSIFEPISSFGKPEPPHLFWGCDVTPFQDLAERMRATFRRYQPDDVPMRDFDERDLLSFAEGAGFEEVRLDYRPDMLTNPWDVFARAARNPLVPPLAEAVHEELAPEEAERFISHLRSVIDNGELQRREAVTYLRAVKEE